MNFKAWGLIQRYRTLVLLGYLNTVSLPWQTPWRVWETGLPGERCLSSSFQGWRNTCPQPESTYKHTHSLVGVTCIQWTYIHKLRHCQCDTHLACFLFFTLSDLFLLSFHLFIHLFTVYLFTHLYLFEFFLFIPPKIFLYCPGGGLTFTVRGLW